MASSSSTKAEIAKTGSPAPEMTPESAIDHAKRAFALKKYEQAVEHYATALELVYVALFSTELDLECPTKRVARPFIQFPKIR